jgi:hypothetical protein
MPDVSTEVAIATQTLGSAASSIDFTSIGSTYTDLRLVLVTQNTSGGNLTMRFNGDTGSNYSVTTLFGTGSSALAERTTSATSLRVMNSLSSSTNWRLAEIDIFSYAGSTFKTELTSISSDDNGSGSVRRTVGLWRSTSAITSISLFYDSGNHSVGTTATLYGIL